MSVMERPKYPYILPMILIDHYQTPSKEHPKLHESSLFLSTSSELARRRLPPTSEAHILPSVPASSQNTADLCWGFLFLLPSPSPSSIPRPRTLPPFRALCSQDWAVHGLGGPGTLTAPGRQPWSSLLFCLPLHLGHQIKNLLPDACQK